MGLHPPVVTGVQWHIAVTTTVVTTTAVVILIAIAAVALVRRARGARAGGATERATEGTRSRLGAMVLVPIARPRSAAYLVEIAAAFTNAAGGRMLVLTVLESEPTDEERTNADLLLQQAEVAAVDTGAEVSTNLRVGREVSESVLHATVEHDASLVVVGWPSAAGEEGRLGRPVDRIVADAPAPVVIGRLEGHHWQRVLLRLPRGDISHGQLASLRLAVETARRVSHAHGLPLLRSSDPRDERAAALVADVPVDAGGGSEDDPYGDPDVLTVVGVDPAPTVLERELERTASAGDLLVALAHGPAAEDRRPLLRTAQELDEPSDAQAAPRLDEIA